MKKRMILENPTTRQKIALIERTPTREDYLNGASGWFFGNLGRVLGPSLYEALGRPTERLGRGSFAAVFVNPRRENQAIKITIDPMDGQMASAVKAQQSRGKLRGLVRVDAVWRMRHFTDFLRPEETAWITNEEETIKPEDLYVIFVERVIPVTLSKRDALSRALREAFIEALSDTQMDVVGWMRGDASEGVTTESLPGDLCERTLAALKYHAKLLRAAAGRFYLDSSTGYNLNQAASTVSELVRMKMPIADLHQGNWGLRDNGDLVILDFGLSSVPAKAPRDFIETDLVRKPKARRTPAGQQVLFNPRSKGRRVGSALVRRAADFETTGLYDVVFDDRTVRMYRDPENGWWYLETAEDTDRGHHVLGFTMAEAVARLES